GGSYLVSRDNLGRYPSLVAGASLLVDYILTVAVSISAGVAAIVSLPAFHGLENSRVLLGLGLIALITLANLRGLKESGTVFAVPTYLYIATIGSLVLYGLYRTYFGDGPVYVVLQIATAAILTLAANTAYADFPRLSSIIARDGFLPRQFANRGDRLVFSNGVVFLAVAAGALLVAFGGITNALIPLYA